MTPLAADAIHEVEQRIGLPHWIGTELLLSVTGEAEAGSAGEQPAEE